MTSVSIVLLNWNNHPVVLEAAASALAQRSVRVELIIVDNGSSDGSLPKLKKRFPGARFIELGRNTGFTGGMNAGTQIASHEFVLWQNADLVLDPDYCTHGIGLLQRDHTLGGVGGTVHRLVDGRRTELFDAAGFTVVPTHRAVFVRSEREQDVVGVAGSCPLFRLAALQAASRPVGYVLDPWYFAYGEDIDLMLRINLAGWRLRYVPNLLAWHVNSGSTVPRSRFYQKPNHIQVHHFKNRLATVVKCLPTRTLVRRLPILLITEVGVPFYLLVRNPRSVINWLVAWHNLWTERQRLLNDRFRIQSDATPGARLRLDDLLRRPVHGRL